MNNECWICGKKEAIPHKCRYCGKTFCMDHRLPEQHACKGLEKQDGNPFNTGGNSNQRSNGGFTYRAQTDDLVKEMLKNTAKQAAKGAATGFVNRTKSSIKTSPSMAIIFICIASFFLELIFGQFYFSLFMLTPSEILTKPWTIITHMFLHNGLGHLFFNMLVLFFFGRELEKRAGNRILLNVFFTAGIVAAIGYSLTRDAPVVGASGAIYGVFAAIAVLAPEMMVYVYFIPMRIKYALVLFGVMDFLLIGSPDMIAHTAHIIGLLVGLLMGMRIKKAQSKYRTYSQSTRRW